MTDKFAMIKQSDTMNRKNRLAQRASQASSQFNTYLLFKEKEGMELDAVVMNISKSSGIYVIVQ